MKNLNTFINEFRDGFQFNNRFMCKVIVPQQLQLKTEGNYAVAEWLAKGILCESTNLPDRAFAETQMTQYGLTEQFPFHSEFTSLQCVFNTPLRSTGDTRNDNPVPRFFHSWQDLIQDLSEGYDSTRDFTFSGTNHTNGYYGELQLGVFDRHNNLTIAYEFERVYPQIIQATPVSWREENELTKLAVGFTFSTWRAIPQDKAEGLFGSTELLRGVGFMSPFNQTQLELGSPNYNRGDFQEGRFTPPRTTIGGILTGIATDVISDVISDVTNGRVRIR